MTNVTLLSFSPTKLLFPLLIDDKSSLSFPFIPLTVTVPFSITVIVGVYPSFATPFSFTTYLVPTGRFSNTSC
ncbi:hypothetical protein R2R32_16730 [Clostridium perfringens]|nr:hypothetical protein [Clostridium perfringens]